MLLLAPLTLLLLLQLPLLVPLLLLPSLPLLLLPSLPLLLPLLLQPLSLPLLPLSLLPTSTLGLEPSSATRARARSVSLGLALGVTLGGHILGDPDVPHGAVPAPVREATRVATPRRVLPQAVLVRAVVAPPDCRADKPLPGPYPVSWSPTPLRLGTSLSLELVRSPTHSPPSP